MAMNSNKLSNDDPRLTAYALGELDRAEIASVEAALRTDTSAQEAVSDIRALAKELEAALANEPVEMAGQPIEYSAPRAPARGNVIHFPLWMWGSAAAACLAFVLAAHLYTSARAPESNVAQPVLNRAAVQQAIDSATAESNHRRPGISDGFSDVKPATFREDGLKLGKSVASNRDFSPSRDFGSPRRL